MGTARGFLGAGDIYIARYDTQALAFLPPAGPYESTKFQIKATTKLTEMTGRGKGTYGQIIESVATPQPTEFEMEIAEVNRESMALAVLGSVATYTQTGAVVSSPVNLTAELDAWAKLAHHTLTAGTVVVKDVTDATIYVLGTDYEVNHALGWIKALSTGAIAQDDVLHVTYTYGTVAGHRVRGVTDPQVRAQIMFDGINLADNSPCLVECYEAVISSSAAFDFLADKFNSVPMTGRLKTPTGKTEPFEIRLPNG